MSGPRPRPPIPPSTHLTVGSLFAGIGGFDLAFERAGMKVAWQCENDEQCCAVLDRWWPDVPRYADVHDVKGADVAAVDVLCGGFPCQDLSVAGRRAGLDGTRSGLWWEFARLVAELGPTWVVVENVPGMLSSRRGRDMGAVLGTLADMGYGYAWRVLDAQWFGLAQRRRRVFIVGHSRNPTAAAQVLLEPESSTRHSSPRRTTQATVAHALRASTGARGSDDPDRLTFVAVPQADAVRRLTPRECERLQGFPDGWTEGLADRQRYRMLGNAVAVPVAEWIGRRIAVS